MRLDNQKPSDNVEDRREDSGGFGPMGGSDSSGMGGGGGLGGMGGIGGALLPVLFRAVGFKGIVILGLLYLALKFFVGIDLLNIGGGHISLPGNQTQIELPNGSNTQVGQANSGADAVTGVPGANVTADAGKEFVARVLGSTEDVWSKVFKDMGQQYEKPPLVMFTGYTNSGCGTAQSAMGPFYCPQDHKVYIDLAFYQDMKNKLGAPGDFAQAYVVAHEVGHHVQTLLGIADQVQSARSRSSEADSNALSVRMELQADCFAGIWATEAEATKHITLEAGDVEEALNAAKQIGDDRLQKRSQGYAVPETFTHGTSKQRVKWFKAGMAAQVLKDCDTFSADPL
jgi:predicted metalloprotease